MAPDATGSARIALLGADQFELAATDPNLVEGSARPLDKQFISLDGYAVDRSSST
ncbi:hypothetical protein [Mesorhizobium sp. M1396]|uniref:hypothetical protein n=1 Tax=Mesorhizobium sp. M1396 TaxID=2957095 RepID=UPI00333CB293